MENIVTSLVFNSVQCKIIYPSELLEILMLVKYVLFHPYPTSIRKLTDPLILFLVLLQKTSCSRN